jgi:anti-sigma regulatory factor (Ser/Thr protein kinase)
MSVPGMPEAMAFAVAADVAAVRAFVRARALELGLPVGRAELLMLAVSELATNTLQHTSGGGRVRVWLENGHINCDVCDVWDGGTAPTFGRSMPPPESVRGRGLPIVEMVSDAVTTSAGPEGTLVRIRLDL